MYKYFFKRFIDFWISLIVLIIISPILLAVTIWLHFANKGAGAFFLQERPGKDAKIFKVIKFKTMTDERDADGNLLPDEKRLTKVGKFVRSTSIDELPQLINVLKGDMALIGPRPLLPEYLPRYSPGHAHRHDIRPGITGWAQVNGRTNISWKDKLDYDIWYVNHLSFGLDLKIIFMTIINVIKREDVILSDVPFENENIKKMKHLIIIAAGGFGRETYCSATEAIGYGTEFDIKGFLDDDPYALDGYEGYPPIIGTPDSYEPQEDDVFQCAVGSVKMRRELSEKILTKGGEFLTLIHKTAYISKNVTIGKGCMILAGARIQCDAKVGDYVIMQPYTILGHDVQVGNWSLINALADCGGMSKVGEMCTINTTAFILPLSKVEDGATVGAESLVLRKVKAGQTVMGVPAKPLLMPGMPSKK